MARIVLASLAAAIAVGLIPQAQAAVSSPAATLSIPKLGIHDVVIRYATPSNEESLLDQGPIWWPGIPGRPGEGQVMAIAGHDVTSVPGFDGHGPFHFLNTLKKGDLAQIRWKGKLRSYRYTGSRYLPYDDYYAVEDKGHEALALSTCWPPYQKAHRLYAWFLPVKPKA